MSTKHTPGPWEFRTDGGWRLYADGECIMGNEQYYPWVPESAADWRLIAAAPELLSALCDLMQTLEFLERSGHRIDPKQVSAARDAIAKAQA